MSDTESQSGIILKNHAEPGVHVHSREAERGARDDGALGIGGPRRSTLDNRFPLLGGHFGRVLQSVVNGLVSSWI